MPTIEYLDYNTITAKGWDIDDDGLFEKAEAAELDEEHHGRLETYENEGILVAAERNGLMWPFSCRNGSCANCACILKEGEATMTSQVALNEEEITERNIRLTCISKPESDEIKLVFNAKELDYLQNRVI